MSFLCLLVILGGGKESLYHMGGYMINGKITVVSYSIASSVCGLVIRIVNQLDFLPISKMSTGE